jgi:hypothetical protein
VAYRGSQSCGGSHPCRVTEDCEFLIISNFILFDNVLKNGRFRGNRKVIMMSKLKILIKQKCVLQ